MKSLSAIVIGAGQCGLAMSRELTWRGVDHAVLDRGRLANSWREERWDSLRLLTPNWMNGLPGLPYDGPDPDGYMTSAELLARFERAAANGALPLRTRTQVLSVRPGLAGYAVQTDRGQLQARAVVIATGACTLPDLPDCAADLPPSVHTTTALQYKRPEVLPDGPVLVVGASASGLQIARELALAGRRVILSVGTHLRLPRRYRGADILTWMEALGLLRMPYGEVDDIDRVRRTPSLTLLGSDEPRALDLNALQDMGVEIAGRLQAVRDGRALFSGGLGAHVQVADLKLGRLLDTIDTWIETAGIAGLAPPPERPVPTRVPAKPRLGLDFNAEKVGSVIWATGYRPDHGFLRMPVFDRRNRIRHDGGRVARGLYVTGLPYLRTRQSSHIAGAQDDARALAASLFADLARARAA